MIEQRQIRLLTLVAGIVLGVFSAAQAATIRGKITETGSGHAVESATVLVTGTSLGAVSGLDGSFAIDGVEPGSYKLEIFRTGYKKQTKEVQVKAAGSTPLDISLSSAVYDLEETVVTGARGTETPARTLPASISVVSSDEMEMRNMLSADEGLRYVPGATVVSRRTGLATTGNHAGVTLRGVGSAFRTLVLKDGIPQNGTYVGNVSNWNSMATSNLKRIEVVRGAAGSLYGSAAMGGVINLITDSPRRQSSMTIRSEYGSQGTSVMGVKAGKAFSNGLGVMLTGERKMTDGYRYLSDKDWQDYYVVPNTDLLNTNLKVDYELRPGSKMEFIYNLDWEQPDWGTNTEYDNDYKSNDFSLRYTGRGNVLSYEGTVFVRNRINKSRANSYSAETGRHDNPFYNYRIPTNDLGFLGTINARFKNHSLSVGTDLIMGTAKSRYNYAQYGEQYFEGEQLLTSAYLNDDISLGESWSLSLGVRYDRWNNRDGYFNDKTGPQEVSINYPDRNSSRVSPRAGLVYHIDENSRLRASYSTGFKAPGLYLLYRSGPHAPGTYDVGNPYLKPEIMNYSADIGTDFLLFDKLESSLTVFSSSFKDLVALIPISPDKISEFLQPSPYLAYYRFENLGKVDLNGFETDFRLLINENWTASFNYAYTDAEIVRYEANPALVGRRLEESPKNAFNLGLVYENPRLFGAGAWLHYTGKQFADPLYTAAKQIDGYGIVDIKAHRELAGGVDLSLSVRNLFDKQYYSQYSSEMFYYYGAPRMVLVGLNYAY